MLKNIFEAIPHDLTKELFNPLISNERIKIERIVSKGHQSPDSGWYDQARNEWVIVLAGEAKLTFEEDAGMHLKPGDFVHIPAHKKHKVAWTDPEVETIWLAVHY